MSLGRTQRRIVSTFIDGKPLSQRDIVKMTGLTPKSVEGALRRAWIKGFLLRTKKPFYESEKIFKGRDGNIAVTRPYHLYIPSPMDSELLQYNGAEFVGYSKEYLDVRGGGGRSKAGKILEFLRTNSDKAWFSKEITQALKNEGVRQSDIMANVKRFERKGLVFVRGFRTNLREIPFERGFLITWIDQDKPRDAAMEEAIKRTVQKLDNCPGNPVLDRVRMLRDVIIAHTKTKELVSYTFLRQKLRWNEHEMEYALDKAFKLCADLKEVKLFDNYRFFYHTSMNQNDLETAMRDKMEWIRANKGQANRIGHNFEAAVEWFVDNLSGGVEFVEQKHRDKMDPRRITLFLIKPVNRRKNKAEVDRVWRVRTNPFSSPITYVLECKWGLIRKEHIDDFFNVLKYSTLFGTDTPTGRHIKQGVIGIFAGGAFDTSGVRLHEGTTVTLVEYAARMNIEILKVADLNEKLRQRGISPKVTIQKICRLAKHEKEVREILCSIWEKPEATEEIVSALLNANADMYDFESKLEIVENAGTN